MSGNLESLYLHVICLDLIDSSALYCNQACDTYMRVLKTHAGLRNSEILRSSISS